MKNHANTNPPRRTMEYYFWPLLVIGLLILQLIMCAGTVYFSLSDGSSTIESNYYDRAVKWDGNRTQQ